MNADELASYVSSLEQKNAELEHENTMLKEANTYLRNMLMRPLTLKQAFEQLFSVYADMDALDQKLRAENTSTESIKASGAWKRFEYSDEHGMIFELYERIPIIWR